MRTPFIVIQMLHGTQQHGDDIFRSFRRNGVGQYRKHGWGGVGGSRAFACFCPATPATTILFTNIFPFPFNPVAEENEISILNVYLNNFKPVKVQYKASTLVFDAICHQNLWRLSGSSSGLRPFLIANDS